MAAAEKKAWQQLPLVLARAGQQPAATGMAAFARHARQQHTLITFLPYVYDRNNHAHNNMRALHAPNKHPTRITPSTTAAALNELKNHERKGNRR